MAAVAAQPVVDDVVVLPEPLKVLTDLVDQRVEGFAAGDEDIRDAGLAAAKFIFDAALKSEAISYPAIEALVRAEFTSAEEPITTRSSSTPAVAGKKRKRDDPAPAPAPSTSPLSLQPTPLNELFVQGMDEDQVWEQLELRAKRVCTMAQGILETSDGLELDGEEEGLRARDMLELLGDEEMGSEEDEDEDEDEDSDPSLTEDETEETEEEEDEAGGDPEEGYGEEGLEELRDEEDEDFEDGDIDMDARPALPPTSSLKKRPQHPTLDDDFFSIDDFNRETEALEARVQSSGRLAAGEDDEDEMDEDVDLFGAVPDDAEVEDEPAYGDFFAPVRVAGRAQPQSKSKQNGKPNANATASGAPGEGKTAGVRFNDAVRVKTIKPKKRKMKLDFDLSQYPFMGGEIDEEGMELDDDDEDSEEDGDFEGGDDGDAFGEGGDDEDEDEDEEDEEDLEADDGETITRLKDDLFGEEDSETEAAHLSTHQKRQAALSEQIRALEGENVGQKDWTLMGEASARSRPVNSLLEEDLDFEHVAKQVPVVTEETTRTLEELIKRRILDNNFNDVVRKRPVDDKAFLPSRMFELQDARSQKSLAQIYEDEYTAARTGDTTVVDDRDGKLRKEHEEIEKMWEGIAYKLDALSNAHFTPKAPKATIQTVSNLPAISMESAMPTTTSTSTMLAPEEIFSARAAALVAKSEMTPVEKKTQRRKSKTVHKRQEERLGQAVQSFTKVPKGASAGADGKKGKGKKGVRGEKEDALRQMVKEGRGVTVVGKESKGKGREKAVPRASLLKL